MTLTAIRKQKPDSLILYTAQPLFLLLIKCVSEHLLETPAGGSVYKISTIRLATFFGGPLAGGYMIAANFKTFGDEKKQKITWLFTALITMLIFVLSLLPALTNVPGISYTFAYFFIANFFATKYQQQNINLHLEEGGKEFSKGNAILVSVIGLLLVIAPAVTFLLIEDFYISRF